MASARAPYANSSRIRPGRKRTLSEGTMCLPTSIESHINCNRNETKAQQIILDVTAGRSGVECHFIKADITLLKNVEDACREIVRKERKVNVLFLTAGFLTIRGRSGMHHVQTAPRMSN